MSVFEKAIDFIEDCQKRYEEEIILYMQKISAEADKEIAEADKEIAEADKEIAEADKEIAEALNSSLENLVRFYNRYKKDPSTIKNDEVTWWKED